MRVALSLLVSALIVSALVVGVLGTGVSVGLPVYGCQQAYGFYRLIDPQPMTVAFRDVWFDNRSMTLHVDFQLMNRTGWIAVYWFYAVPEVYDVHLLSNLTVRGVTWTEVNYTHVLEWEYYEPSDNMTAEEYFSQKIQEYKRHGDRIVNVTYELVDKYNVSGGDVTVYVWRCVIVETLKVMNITVESLEVGVVQPQPPPSENASITSGYVGGYIEAKLVEKNSFNLAMAVIWLWMTSENNKVMLVSMIAVGVSVALTVAVALMLVKRLK